ncbi:MAG: protein translocase subunit SecF [Alphaproteobacteria bacterium]|nr:protein translocase subunit SecF [Alphaproteobacteria bacterium]
MKPLRLIPEKTTVPFIKVRYAAYLVSAFAILASLLLVATRGINFGIDFVGGTIIEVKTDGPADLARIRTIVGGEVEGQVAVQEFGQPDEVLIRIATQPVTEELDEAGAQQAARSRVETALGAAFPGLRVMRSEVIGPKVSGELVRAGTLAVLLAIAAMFFYLLFRFEWQFSTGAVLALIHDVTITIGIFALLQLEFTLSIIAALLTIVGYSMNDTVVVYDRVRENFRKYKKMPLEELLDLSMNDTLSRTVMTSGTTLIALGALYILGGQVIRDFTFAMIWGIVIGTYSSIFVAAPLLLILEPRRDWSGFETKSAGIHLQ